jgi:hypothetical protein
MICGSCLMNLRYFITPRQLSPKQTLNHVVIWHQRNRENDISPKLQAFYNALSDEQKARFNTMGPIKNASATKQQPTTNH